MLKERESVADAKKSVLNAKQKAFCREYVKCYNGTQAAIAAGYSQKTAAVQASRLLRNPAVLDYIKECQKEIIKMACITEEKVLNSLVEVLDRCMSAVPVMEWDYSEHALVETGTYQFDSKGALNAIKLLGLHLGLFDKNREQTNENKDIDIHWTDEMKAYSE